VRLACSCLLGFVWVPWLDPLLLGAKMAVSYAGHKDAGALAGV